MRFYKSKLSYRADNLPPLLIIFMSLFTVHPKGNFCNCFLFPFIITYSIRICSRSLEWRLTPVALAFVYTYFSLVSRSKRYVGANVISSSSTMRI